MRAGWAGDACDEVLHDTSTPGRLMSFVERVHGTLPAGDRGSPVVEIIQGRRIILIITGVNLRWPRGMAGRRVLAPELGDGPGRRETWREGHRMGGARISRILLAVLFFWLAWTQVWGDGVSKATDLARLKTPGQAGFITLASAPRIRAV